MIYVDGVVLTAAIEDRCGSTRSDTALGGWRKNAMVYSALADALHGDPSYAVEAAAALSIERSGI